MIDETLRVSGDQVLAQILASVHQQAVGFQYFEAVPDDLTDGKIGIVDDGTNPPTLVIKTGKGRIASVGLSV